MFKQHGPAPVPADDLAAALAPFGQSRMLPRAAYVDPAVFEWEQRQHLLRLDLRRPRGRSRRRRRAARRRLGRQRRAAGARRRRRRSARSRTPADTAATNCWRAAKRPSAAASCARTTRGRTASTVRLRNAPGFSDVDGFEPAEFGLAELRLVNWHGWLFVDPSGEDADFTEHVAGLEDVVGPYRPEDLTIVARHSYELATNWKVIAENYQECYHCSTIHPELSRISPPTSGENLELDGLVDGRLDVDHRRAPRPCR